MSNHIRDLQFLAIETFKVVKGRVPKIFSDLFSLKEQNNYSLQQKFFFEIPKNETVRNGFESVPYLEPNIWEMLPQEIQECESLLEFKVKIKSRNPINCPCKLCESDVIGVGYI